MIDTALFKGYKQRHFKTSTIIYGDCFDWLQKIPEATIHGVVTDPPYGVKEYSREQLKKRATSQGGVWRIPPSFDGSKRAPLPRFTALSDKDKSVMRDFFVELGSTLKRVLVPGAHVFLASNALLSQIVFSACIESGLEFRGELIRLVRTFRGGDRPKNAEQEFAEVCSMPRSCYEPWGIFRKPTPSGMTVSECLRTYGTGGLRRVSIDQPFCDVIESTRTPKREREIAPHPSLKPQDFLRQLVYAVLPLGQGIILDPFMGSGSTIAAAEALQIQAIGIERIGEYFDMAETAIPKLTELDFQEYGQLTLYDSLGVAK